MTPQELIAALEARRVAVQDVWFASRAKPETSTYAVLHQAYAAVVARKSRAEVAFNPALHPSPLSIVERLVPGVLNMTNGQ